MPTLFINWSLEVPLQVLNMYVVKGKWSKYKILWDKRNMNTIPEQSVALNAKNTLALASDYPSLLECL